MPRFLLPVLVLFLTSLTGLGFVVLKLDPEQASSVVLFLLTFFLSLTSVLSLAFFFIHKKFFFKPKTFSDLRPLFRASLRKAFLIALLATLLLVIQQLR